MGFLDKIMFWKKGDSLDLGNDFGMDPSQGFGNGSFGANQSMNQGMGTNQGLPSEPSMPNFGGYPSAHTFDDSQFGGEPKFTVREIPRQESYQQQNYTAEKNMEIISSKLDALKAGIESLNQRLANLERIAQGEQETHRRQRNYW
jgi:hypothetical protein